MHAAGASDCPRIAFFREKSRILMEARILQQVRAAEPAATIGETRDFPPLAEADSAHTPPRSENQGTTYAAAVRGVTVERDGKAVTTVLLPKPVAVRRPRQRKHLMRTRRSLKKNLPQRSRKVPSTVSNFGELLSGLGPAIGLLGSINPELAKALKVIVKGLQPLLKLLPLLKQLKATHHK